MCLGNGVTLDLRYTKEAVPLGVVDLVLLEEELDALREALHGIILGLGHLWEVRISTINWKDSFVRFKKVVEEGQYERRCHASECHGVDVRVVEHRLWTE